MKRGFELTVVILSLPFWLPLLAALALVTLLFEGWPVFFVQERTGYLERPFWIYKFRTMRLGEGSDAERLTRYGKFLRKTSLDELPELLNVLRGEMSLVGPRPLPVRYLERYPSEVRRRHAVLPGITGLAQVNGRNALDWEKKFRYDLEYVERRSLALDAKILAMTFMQLWHPRGISHAGAATMEEYRG